MNRFCALWVAGVFALPGGAMADVINFDDLGVGVEVTNQYGSAVFSTIGGQQNLTLQYGFGNILCTAENGAPNCLKPTFVDFPSPVNGLTFVAVEPNEFGVVATISVFQKGNHTADVDLIGLGMNPGEFGYGNKSVDLSGYSNITRIELRGPDGGDLDNAYSGSGIGWDEFSFTVVPSPGAGALFGFAAAVAARRRR